MAALLAGTVLLTQAACAANDPAEPPVTGPTSGGTEPAPTGTESAAADAPGGTEPASTGAAADAPAGTAHPTPAATPFGSLTGRQPPRTGVLARENRAYLGTYASPTLGEALVIERDGALVLQGPGDGEFPLEHWNGDVFVTPLGPPDAPAGSTSAVTFTIGPDGRAAALTIEYFDQDRQGTLSRVK